MVNAAQRAYLMHKEKEDNEIKKVPGLNWEEFYSKVVDNTTNRVIGKIPWFIQFNTPDCDTCRGSALILSEFYD